MPGFRMGTSTAGSLRSDALGGFSDYQQSLGTNQIAASKQDNKIIRVTIKPSTGDISSISGALGAFFVFKRPAGSISSLGNPQKIISKVPFTGGSSASKSLRKRAVSLKTGNATSAGSINKKSLYNLAGTINSEGSLNNLIRFIYFIATIASTSTVLFSQGTSVFNIIFGGSIASVGIIAKESSISMIANIASVGITKLKSLFQFSAEILSSATIVKKQSKNLIGAASSAGIARKHIRLQSFAGTSNISKLIGKRTQKRFAGTITSRMVFFKTKLFMLSFASSIASSGVVTSIYAQGLRVLEEMIISIKDFNLSQVIKETVGIIGNVLTNKTVVSFYDRVKIEIDLDVQ